MSEITRLTGSFNFGQQVTPIRADADPVVTDGTTIGGDGTAGDPIHAIDSTEEDIQRLAAAGAINTTSALTIAVASGASLHTFTLADGTEDGFQKTICLNPTSFGGTYQINAQFSPTPGYTFVAYPQAGGALTVIWDDTNGWWMIQSNFLGTPTV